MDNFLFFVAFLTTAFLLGKLQHALTPPARRAVSVKSPGSRAGALPAGLPPRR